MIRFGMLVFGVVAIVLTMNGCGDDDNTITRPAGWAIGWHPDNTAAILYTRNGGETWEEQGNTSQWTGMSGNDISAVDELTAWAAVGSGDGRGAILHTTDGGTNWSLQPLPAGVSDVVKGIRGISRSVAWAVTLGGTVMRTLDGGQTWVVVPHDGATIKQVNRMDVKGEDIYIADVGSGAMGMIHSADAGRTWRQEYLPGVDPKPGCGPMCVSIVNAQVVWAAIRPEANIYRTVDGGSSWHLDAPRVSGPNDLDDICAPSADMAWTVQNISGMNGGRIISVRLVNGQVVTDIMDPMGGKYQYEGVTCSDEKNVWVVGFKSYSAEPGLPDGVILHTADGNAWTSQPLPVKDAGLWKVSFVAAHR